MKLIWQILLLILVTISLSALANLLLTRYQGETLYRDSEKILADTIVQSLRDALVQDVIDGNKLRVSDLLKNLKRHENPIEFLYVTDTNHAVFAHSFEQGFPRYLARQEPHIHVESGIHLINKYQTEDGLIHVYSEPLVPGLEAILHIGINQSDIARKLAKNTGYVLELNIAAVLLALTIAYLWGRQITAPLAIFTEQIQRYRAGEKVDFSRLKKNTPEISQLATAFQGAIEERQHALTTLQEREQNLAITLNSIGDAVITTDDKGNVTRMNPVAEQLTGWSDEQAQNQSLKTIFPIIDASTREPIANPVDKVIATGETVFLSNHTTLIARDGTEYQIADSAAPIRDKEGITLGMVLVFNDITEQYRLREAAKDVQKKLQSVFDDMLTMVGLLDIDGTLTFISNTPLKAAGIKQEDVLGKKLWDCVWLNHDPELQATVQKDIANAAAGNNVLREIQISTLNGLAWVDFSIHPIFDEHGNVIQLVPEGRDISQRKAAEEQLHRSQKMDVMGKLTGGIAHDYNNMLGVIIGYADLLKGELSENHELARYVQEIHRAAERGSKLTKKLLSFSQQARSSSTILNMNTLLLNEQHMLEKTLTARINLTLDLAEALWPVYLDSSDLEDAILNMSINAMHAMESGGQLTIQTRNESINKMDSQLLQIEEGDYVTLSITDTGSGIDDTIIEKIFDPFYSTKGDEGTGLGLSQVYGFVKRSNGVIKVYSETGQGTRFALYFPRYQDKKSEDSEHKTNDNSVSLTGTEFILVVDDEPALLDITRTMLHQQGYQVLCAENAKQALEILETESIDLMLSDVIMPSMDGYQLADIAQKQYPDMKIQLASGFSDDRHVNIDDDVLHKNLLQKPYHSQTLFRRVRELLDEQ